MSEVKLHPAWRQAEVDLLAQGITYGSLVTQEWLDEAFGIVQATTIAQHQKNELIRLRQFQELQQSLLENHRMMLAPVRGVGYSVVPPGQQTSVSMKRRTKEIKAAMAKMLREVRFVNEELLTEDQRKEHTDAAAKLGQLRSMLRKQLAAPPTDSEEV